MSTPEASDAVLALAVAQFLPGADAAANLARIDELTASAADRGAALVVFPEYSGGFIDPFDETLVEHAQPLDGPFVAGLVDLAARRGMHVVAGMLERTAGARVRNAVVAVDGDGIVARYRKQHLFDAFGYRESAWVEPGPLDAPETFTVRGVRCGIQTCYDLRFPESTRVLVDAGADVVLVPAQWVRAPLKEHQWTTLVAARAIENTVVVAAADQAPPQGVGNSLIVDAEGMTLAGVGTGEGVAVAHVDRREIEQVRRRNPALALRRYRVVAAG